MNRLSKHDLNLLLVALIWGANYSIGKRALVYTSPVTYAAVRYLISTAVLWLVFWYLKQITAIPRAQTLKLLGWGVVGHTLNQLSFLAGLKLTSATNSALIFGNLPVVVALIGMLMGVERPRPRVWLGIVLGTAGVLMVVGAKGFRFGEATSKGDLLSVAALIFWAIFTVGVRQASMGISSGQATALTHLGGTPGILLIAAPTLASGSGWPFHRDVWIGLLFSSLVSSLVAAVLWTRSLKALGGARTALYNCITPLFAAGFAWLLLGERPVPFQAVGAVLVIVGVLVSREPEVADGRVGG